MITTRRSCRAVRNSPRPVVPLLGAGGDTMLALAFKNAEERESAMKSRRSRPQAEPTRRSVLKTAAAAAGLSVVSVAAPGVLRSARAEQPIKVGLISPLTGAWTVYGKAHSAGLQLGIDEINAAGGVLGRKLEVIVGNSKTEPRIVVEQANRLIRQEGVDFLAGTFSSAERNAAGPVVTSANKILLYPTFYEGQEQEYYPGVCNKNIFMFGPEPTQQVWPHVDYMVKNFGNKFFMIGSDYAWPHVTNDVTKRKLNEVGAQVVGELYIPFNTPQYEIGVAADSGFQGEHHLSHTHRLRHRQFPQAVRGRRHEQGFHAVDGGRRRGGHFRTRAGRFRRCLRELRLFYDD